jgi:hypothetical protein
VALVATLAGHSSSRVTECIYGHITGADVRIAADLMERRLVAK